MDRFDADYALPNIMLTTFLAYYGDDILFKDISFKPRQGGTNSINILFTPVGLQKAKYEIHFEISVNGRGERYFIPVTLLNGAC